MVIPLLANQDLTPMLFGGTIYYKGQQTKQKLQKQCVNVQ